MGIQGTTISLLTKKQVGVDDFNAPVYEWSEEEVDNVLVGEPTAQERIDDLNLTGRSLAYVLGIPKGDTHNWENQRVRIFGQLYITYDIPVEGIEANIPLAWHKKVKCARYE